MSWDQKPPGPPKRVLSTPQSVVVRRYAQATAEQRPDGSWRVLAQPLVEGSVPHTLGRGATEDLAWADAAGRCMR